ncbi:aldose 1-epimerase family protein [Arthrobacter sp. 35W]|uniref:aldose 1-epimerase family protein n=1 Tax=Arthrobacter sp. 35W TaxID=1132441 RepID=UPI000406FC50|nr:aldose 1-epimerase family protein [Arthrobacter sp. 35W]
MHQNSSAVGAPTLPTGRQFTISWDDGGPVVEAVVTEIGGTIRQLTVDGSPLVEEFAESGLPAHCEGEILIPWPNRVRDGRWEHSGRVLQLPLNEPERGNAIHGLTRDLPHSVVGWTPSEVILRVDIAPGPGYPFALVVETAYSVSARGLEVRHTVANASALPAPVAIGAHPYIRVGAAPTEESALTVNAASYVVVDDRLNPTGSRPVAGTPCDLSAGPKVGWLDLDTAFADLVPSADGCYRHTLEAPNGDTVEVWGDANYRYAQVYTTNEYPAGGRRTAVAVEPMTAPPDAFNSGEGLRWLDPGESWSSSWGIAHNFTTAQEPNAAEGRQP